MRAARRAALLAASRCRQVVEQSGAQNGRLQLHEICQVAASLSPTSSSASAGASTQLPGPRLTAAICQPGSTSSRAVNAGISDPSEASASKREFSTASRPHRGPAANEEAPICRSGPMASYQRQVAEGHLMQGDLYQEAALAALQALYDVLMGAAADGHLVPRRRKTHSESLWSRWLPKAQPAVVRGLYLWGGVGTGKTMLMDMFYRELPDWMCKRRVHFHDLMLSVHSKLQKHRGMADPLLAVAQELRQEATVLCLDEFMVTDVADAMILNRLFSHLFAEGVVLVSTSNRPPDRLYENGLQRDLFLPFIAVLKSRCVVHEIGSPTDYRRLTAVQRGLYFTGHDASSLLQEKVALLGEGSPGKAASVELVMGRRLQVPHAAQGTAYFQFYELCEMPLGAADFFGLVKHFHTVALDGVPRFGASNRAAAYRFVTLVDVMYEHKARLVCSAEGAPHELFERVVTIEDAPKKTSSRSRQSEDADLAVDNELGFAKERTISRLTEMQSSEYQVHHEANYKRGAALASEESQVAQAS